MSCGVDDGERGGGRSLGVDEIDDTARRKTSSLHLRDLRELPNPTEARTGPFGHRSLVGDELVRRRHTGLAVIGVAARNQPRGEGEMMAGLTGSWMGGSFGSGKRRSERAAKGISGDPRRKKGSGMSSRSSWRRLAWCRGRRGRGGSCGIPGWARGGRWTRQRRAAAAAALG